MAAGVTSQVSRGQNSRDTPRAANRIPLLGREDEWNALSHALGAVRQGRSQLVFIEGEAGIGKTRLIEELVAAASASGFSVLAGRAEQLERIRPFGAIADALARFDAEQLPSGKTLRGLLRPDGVTVQTQVPGEVLLVDAFVDFVEQLALSGPACIAIEDLHWADAATIAAMRAVGRRLSYLPILTVGSYRPHPRSHELSQLLDVASRDGAIELRLARLDEESVLALIEPLVAGQAGARLRRVINSAAGNPLYATEIARALSEEGGLTVEGGVAEVATEELPPSLRLTILRRISFLPTDTLEMLGYAATVGSRFRIQELVALSASAAPEVIRTIGPAMEAKLVEEREDGLSFRHDLIREAIYEDVPATVRAAMHVDAARALRSLDAAPVRVAGHLIRGLDLGLPELFDEAIGLATDLRLTARTVAISLYEKALALPGIAERRRRRARIDMAFPLMTSGRMDDAERLARELLSTSGDPTDEAWTLAVLLEGKMRMGYMRDSLPLLERVAGDPRITDRASHFLRAAVVVARVRLGSSAGTRQIAVELIDEGRATRDDNTLYAGLLAGLVLDLHEGRVLNAVAKANQLLEIDRRTRTPFSNVLGQVLTWLEADRLSEAREACRQGRSLEPEIGDLSWLATHSSAESCVCLLEGSWDDAVIEAEAALGLVAEGLGSADLVLGAYVALAQVDLRRGNLDRARERIDEADRFVAERGPQWLMAPLAWTKALYLHISKSPREALDAFAEGWDAAAQSRYFLTRPAFADLVRLALEADDRRRAEQVAEEAEENRRRSDGIASIEGMALQCHGLVADDPDLLLAAVDAYRKSPRALERARVCEDAAVALARRGRTTDARRLFDEALAFHEGVDAELDVRRVTSAMRAAGLRRGSRAKRRRPTVGWDALTATELQVAQLTIEGLTNPQIANRLFISKRTVQTHLSHVFAKLGIASRVALAAIAAEKLSSSSSS